MHDHVAYVQHTLFQQGRMLPLLLLTSYIQSHSACMGGVLGFAEEGPYTQETEGLRILF